MKSHIFSPNPTLLDTLSAQIPKSSTTKAVSANTVQPLVSIGSAVLFLDLDIQGIEQLIDTLLLNTPKRDIVAFSDSYDAQRCVRLFRKGLLGYFTVPVTPEKISNDLTALNQKKRNTDLIESLAFDACFRF